MAGQKPSIPKGTRDFGPVQMAKRNFIFSTVRNTFEKYGFMPLETPSFENLSVLTGKYGDEGDRLIFKILKSGNFLHKAAPLKESSTLFGNDIYKASSEDRSALGPLTRSICEKALRYDLTVPFARYVVMNRNEISFPFKRYQIQPVWRADRPQKGRYQEFYQCDADVVGTKSLLCEAEIIMMINEVLPSLGITDYSIKVNNRKILSGIAEALNVSDKQTDLFVAIDKLDKIGWDKVIEELLSKGFNQEQCDQLKSLLETEGGNTELLASAKSFLSNSEAGLLGVSELEEVLQKTEQLKGKLDDVEIDLTLARGLNYYTGAIFEVKVNNVSIGSISGGGRYDDLTGVFGMPDVPGVGFSFGVDRIYDVMEELELFPEDQTVSSEVLIANFGEETLQTCYELLADLRAAGIKSEFYPDKSKMKKQMTYADNKGIPHVVMIGTNELEEGLANIKSMESGEQSKVDLAKIIQHFQ